MMLRHRLTVLGNLEIALFGLFCRDCRELLPLFRGPRGRHAVTLAI